MRPRAGNTRPYGIPETLMQSVGVDDSAARTFMEISRHRRADEDIRPYGKYGFPVHFIGASTSAARLFMENSPLPAGGASPSPTAFSEGPTYLVGPTHSRPPGGCAFFLPLHTVPEERSVTGGPVCRPYGYALAFRTAL